MAAVRIAVRLSSLGLPLRQSLATAAGLGAQSVQLDAGVDVRLSELSSTGLRQLRKMVSDFDLRLSAIRFSTRHGYDRAEGLSQRVEATESVMRIAYQLGAPLVINAIGQVPDSPESPQYAQLAAVVGDLGRYGARVGTLLAAETGTESGPALAGLLQQDDQGYVAVALNPGQLVINRFDVQEAVAALADRIQIVIATDGVLDLAVGRGQSVPLGEGTADYPALIARLEQRRYPGVYVVGDGQRSADGRRRITAAIDYLRGF